jgi:hypothetical protein
VKLSSTGRNPITITFGSNRFINTNGAISIRGKELLKIEVGDDLQPKISVDVLNQEHKLVGKVWKSTSFVLLSKNYEPIYEHEGDLLKRFGLTRKSTGEAVLEIIFHTSTEVEINGIFFVEGINFPIIATKEYLDLNTKKFDHRTKVKDNKGIEIEEDFMAI